MIHFCKAEQTHGHHGPARYAYAINPLLDRDTDCVLDVEATPARFAARVAATQALVSRASTRLGIEPASLAADKAYGSGPPLGWPLGTQPEATKAQAAGPIRAYHGSDFIGTLTASATGT